MVLSFKCLNSLLYIIFSNTFENEIIQDTGP